MKLALLLASVAVVTGFGSFEMDSALPGRMTYSGNMDDCTTWQSEEDCVRRGCGWLPLSSSCWKKMKRMISSRIAN